MWSDHRVALLQPVTRGCCCCGTINKVSVSFSCLTGLRATLKVGHVSGEKVKGGNIGLKRNLNLVRWDLAPGPKTSTVP